MCPVPPSHIANSVTYASNVVYPPFIEAATGNSIPPHPPLLPPQRPAPPPSPLPPPPPPPPPSNYNWTIVNEVGDGACLLRCIARKVFGDPERHVNIRENILQYITQHLHDPLNNSGLSSHDDIPSELASSLYRY